MLCNALSLVPAFFTVRVQIYNFCPQLLHLLHLFLQAIVKLADDERKSTEVVGAHQLLYLLYLVGNIEELFGEAVTRGCNLGQLGGKLEGRGIVTRRGRFHKRGERME